jgi:hypothetical protein
MKMNQISLSELRIILRSLHVYQLARLAAEVFNAAYVTVYSKSRYRYQPNTNLYEFYDEVSDTYRSFTEHDMVSEFWSNGWMIELYESGNDDNYAGYDYAFRLAYLEYRSLRLVRMRRCFRHLSLDDKCEVAMEAFNYAHNDGSWPLYFILDHGSGLYLERDSKQGHRVTRALFPKELAEEFFSDDWDGEMISNIESMGLEEYPIFKDKFLSDVQKIYTQTA